MGLSNEAKDSLLQAIDIIANNAANALPYDSTVKAEIINNDNASDGYYTVQYENTKFTAYSEVTTYKVKDIVRVSIPNSDFSEQKYILGKWAGGEGSEPITYVSVSNSVLEIMNLINKTNINDIAIEANGPNREIVLRDYTPNLSQSFGQGDGNEVFNTLFIEASFQSKLNNLQMADGTYGLRLIIYDKDSQVIGTLELDSSEFFGNPYSFLTPVEQSKKLDISDLGQIRSLSLEIYQNNNFSYYDGNSSEPIILEPTGFNNIFVKTLRIGFGTDLSLVEDNTVKLFCNNDLSYEFSNRSKSKEIGLLWYNKTQDNTYVGFSDGISKKKKGDDIFSYKNYDENAYLKLSSADNRLKSQISEDAPTDEKSLTLKANVLLDGGVAVKEAYDIIAKDLPSTVQSIKSRIGTSNDIIKKLTNMANGIASVEGDMSEMVSREQYVYSTIEYSQGTILKADEYEEILKIEVKTSESISWKLKSAINLNDYFTQITKKNETGEIEEIQYAVKKDIKIKSRKMMKVFPVEQQLIDLLSYGVECEKYAKATTTLATEPDVTILKEIYRDNVNFILSGAVVKEINEVINDIDTCKSAIDDLVKGDYKSFAGVWAGQHPKLTELKNKLIEQRNIINEKLPSAITIPSLSNNTSSVVKITFKYNGSNTTLQYEKKNSWSLAEWESDFAQEDYENLYSIYWFQYCPGWEEDSDQEIKITDWKNITPKIRPVVSDLVKSNEGLQSSINTIISSLSALKTKIIEENDTKKKASHIDDYKTKLNELKNKINTHNTNAKNLISYCGLETSENFSYDTETSFSKITKISNSDNYLWSTSQVTFYDYSAKDNTFTEKSKKIIVFTKHDNRNTLGKTFPVQSNLGLPTSEKLNDKSVSYWNKDTGSENIPKLTVTLDATKEVEKFKAIIIYNHNRYESNEIVFSNVDKQVNLNITDEDRFGFQIVHGDHSKENYQEFYNFTGILNSSKEKEVERFLKANFKKPTNENTEIFNKSWIYWYVPENASMLTYDEDALINTYKFYTDKKQTVSAKDNTKEYKYKMTTTNPAQKKSSGDKIICSNEKIISKTVNGTVQNISYWCINEEKSLYVEEDKIKWNGAKLNSYKDLYDKAKEENLKPEANAYANILIRCCGISSSEYVSESNSANGIIEFKDSATTKITNQINLRVFSTKNSKDTYYFYYATTATSTGGGIEFTLSEKAKLKKTEVINTDINKVLYPDLYVKLVKPKSGDETGWMSFNEAKTKKYFEDKSGSSDYKALREMYARCSGVTKTPLFLKKADIGTDPTDLYPNLQIKLKGGTSWQNFDSIKTNEDYFKVENNKYIVQKDMYFRSSYSGKTYFLDVTKETRKSIQIKDGEHKKYDRVDLYTTSKSSRFMAKSDLERGDYSSYIGKIKNNDTVLSVYKITETDTTISKDSLKVIEKTFKDSLTNKTYYKLHQEETTEDIFILKDKFSRVSPACSRDGYYCFYKKIDDSNYKRINNETNKCENCGKTSNNCSCVSKSDALENNKKFPYYIKSNFSQDATNNTILCGIDGNRWTLEDTLTTKEFQFGTYGANGTEYSIRVIPSRRKVGKILKTDLIINLYNGSGEEEDFSEPSLSWVGPTSCIIESTGKDHNGKGYIVTLASEEIKNSTDNNKYTYYNYYAVLKIELKLEKVDLESFYPIPYTPNANYQLTGTTSIVYNSFGNIEEKYCLDPYSISKKEDGKVGDISDVSWTATYIEGTSGGKGISITDTQKTRYMPKIESGDNSLKPLKMFVNNIDCYTSVICKDSEGTVLWIQPIIIMQNRFMSTTLNKWDGEFKVDEEAGTILSSMLGAGKKNSDNSFSGILLGDVKQKAGFEDSVEQIQTGMYGFHEGAMSFGFNVDGTAFLGKSGKGRISFDGNYGSISSALWDGEIGSLGVTKLGTKGMLIDLENGHIDAHDFRLTSQNIGLDSDPILNDEYGDYGYYIRIGNLGLNGDPKTRGYIALDSNGTLDIKVNNLHLTEQLGSANLLRQTYPTKTLLQYVKLTEAEAVAKLPKSKWVEEPVYHPDDDNDETPVSKRRILYYFIKDQNGDYYFQSLDKEKNEFYYLDRFKNYVYKKNSQGYVELYWDVDYKKIDPKVSAWGSDNNTTIEGAESFKYYKVTKNGDTVDVDDTLTTVEATCIKTTRDHDNNQSASIYQVVTLEKGEKYTISGYVTRRNQEEYGKKDFSVTISHSKNFELSEANLNLSDSIQITNQGWFYFEKTVIIDTDNKEGNEKDVTISFDCSVNFYLYHAKLEKGSVATEWTLSQQDVKDGTTTESKKYDAYLTQDEIFKKLITDNETGQPMVGIWLIDTNPIDGSKMDHKELYINATYMSTGILRSRNWNGELKCVERKDSEGNALKDGFGRKLYTYQISKAPTEGMYINLDLGKVWAAKFELDAWNKVGNDDSRQAGLYLNSHPENDNTNNGIFSRDHEYYLRIGDTGQSYIQFHKSGKVDIRANEFSLRGTLGSSNLFNQTSPRQNTLVYCWKAHQDVTSSTETYNTSDNKRKTNQTKSAVTYKKIKYDPTTKKNVYTWTMNNWGFKDNNGNLYNYTNHPGKYIKTWDKDIVYKQNNIVYYEGRFWKAKSDVASAQDNPTKLTAKWQKLDKCPVDMYFECHGVLWRSNATINDYAQYPGNNASWEPFLTCTNNSDDSEHPYYLEVKKSCQIYQNAILNLGQETYTISGYVKFPNTNNNNTLTIVPGTGASSITNYSFNHDIRIWPGKTTSDKLQGNTWHYFEYTFRTEPIGSDKKETKKYSFGFKSNVSNYYLWHLKLEQGSVATDWTMSDADIKSNAESEKNQLDNTLNQEAIFNRLFKDPTTGQVMDGFELIPEDQTFSGRKELYISATYIATGVLRSKNWNGTISATVNSSGQCSLTLSNSNVKKQGMYIDLDNGIIWAADLTLEAGEGGETDFIGLYSSDQLTGTTINNSGSLKTWRIIAGNSFGVTKTGKLYAKNAIIDGKITASSGTIAGFEIAGSDAPSNGFWDYSISKVVHETVDGNKVYYVKFIRGTFDPDEVAFGIKKTIKNKFNNSAPVSRDWSNKNVSTGADLAAADRVTAYTFSVTNRGVLTAKEANITGSITAESLTLSTDQAKNAVKGCIDAPYIKTLNLEVGDEIKMGPNAKISWTNVTNKDGVATKTYVTGLGYQTESQVTEITKDTVTTSYVNALKVTAKDFSAETIDGKTITGSTIRTGTTGSNVKLTAGGEAEFFYNNNSYGRITTSYTASEQYLTFLGNYDVGVCDGLTIGWDENGTAALYVKKDKLIFKGSSISLMSLDGTELTEALKYIKTTSLFTDYHTMTISKNGIDLILYGSVWLGNGTEAVTSDKNLKNSIIPLGDKQETFFNNLKPVTYKYNFGTSGRDHCGFIAQDVLQAIQNSGLTTQEVGAYVETYMDNGTYCGLRYSEFVALNTHMIQKCLKRIEELENEISILKNK